MEAGAGIDTLGLLELCDEIDVSLMHEPAATIVADLNAVRGFLKKRLARGNQP